MPLDSGDTAWVLAASALVLLMTPGLALFYGGMVRARSVINMMLMSFSTIAVVSVIWVLYGYSVAFSPDKFHGLIGGFTNVGLAGTLDQSTGAEGDLIPVLAFAAFQLMFAIITPALITGAIADRAKFAGWLVFSALWVSLVYLPVAHWVFFFDKGNGGWIGDRLGAIDFAGGTAVHINAGAAALALAFVLGRRLGWPHKETKPHNIPLVLVGTGLLWFGWFGFNAGSAIAANGLAAIAFMNTQAATAAAVLGWILVERIRTGKVSLMGACCGAVAGLVAITPACAAVEPLGALAIGVAAGMLCAYAVSLKRVFGFDDSLDVVGVHLVGGIVGSLLIGLFASERITGGKAGVFYGGGWSLLGKQAIAVGAVAGFSFVMSYILGKLVDLTIGFRITPDAEHAGVDVAEHGEMGYDLTDLDEELRALGDAPADDAPVSPAPAGVPAAAAANGKVETKSGVSG